MGPTLRTLPCSKCVQHSLTQFGISVEYGSPFDKISFTQYRNLGETERVLSKFSRFIIIVRVGRGAPVLGSLPSEASNHIEHSDSIQREFNSVLLAYNGVGAEIANAFVDNNCKTIIFYSSGLLGHFGQFTSATLSLEWFVISRGIPAVCHEVRG